MAVINLGEYFKVPAPKQPAEAHAVQVGLVVPLLVGVVLLEDVDHEVDDEQAREDGEGRHGPGQDAEDNFSNLCERRKLLRLH